MESSTTLGGGMEPSMATKNVRYRNACFTWNNYPEDWATQLQAHLPVIYVLGGRETAPTTGTPHIQGYVQFKGQQYISALRNMFPKLHWEGAKGSYQDNYAYIHKTDPNPYIWGTPKIDPKDAKRSDLSTIKEAVLKTGDVREVLPLIKNHQGLKFAESLVKYADVERDWPTEVIYVHGESGSGKSRYVREQTRSTRAYWWNQTKWWDGYTRQGDVVIDDFRSHNVELNYMLSLTDRYPMQVETKGGHVHFLAKRIFITSPFPLEDNYRNGSEPQKQFLRRVGRIIFSHNGIYEEKVQQTEESPTQVPQ